MQTLASIGVSQPHNGDMYIDHGDVSDDGHAQGRHDGNDTTDGHHGHHGHDGHRDDRA